MADARQARGKGAAGARMAELVEVIRRHDEAYYVRAAPTVSDAAYDRLFAELQRLEAAHPELVWVDSPTRRVGGRPVPELVSAEHRRPMLSLANTYDRDEVAGWYASLADFLGDDAAALTFTCEPKLDGVAVEVIYEQGKLLRALTRGDGKVGDDVTHAVRTIRSLPLALAGEDVPALLEARGEVIMTRSAFEAVNQRRAEAGEEAFINPRNLASGTLKTLDPAVAAARPMDLRLHGLGQAEGLAATGHWQAMGRLAELGLPTLRALDLMARGRLDEMLDHHDALLERREQLPFEVDGSVLKVDDAALQRRLGQRSRSPRWAIAFKFPARQETTVVREIRVQVGRTGVLTPVALVEPVHVAGVTIENVTLHNRDEIGRLGLCVGDRVLIERAGDVIPRVVAVSEHKGGRPFLMPERCPACATPVEDDPEEVALRCPNRGCPAVLRRRIEHFVGRGAMDIEGVGSKLVDQLVEQGLVSRLSDLFALDEAALAGLERMGETSARNVLACVAAARTRPLARLLFALGIRHVGQHVAEVLAEHWPDLERLRAATPEALQAVAQIGPAVAEQLAAWLADGEEQADLERMLLLGLAPAAPAARGGALAGRSFLFTGKLTRCSRREAQQRVKAAGGSLLSAVSRNLDVLVVGDKPGSKRARAEELGVRILDEEAFLAELEAAEGPQS